MASSSNHGHENGGQFYARTDTPILHDSKFAIYFETSGGILPILPFPLTTT
jgi:hypothetical protein